MNFNNKANNMFKIIGRYIFTDTFEKIDSTDSKVDAYKLLYEYRLSFGNQWQLEVVEE